MANKHEQPLSNESNLTVPIPNLSAARANKENYRDWPIDESNTLYSDPLVPISDFGLAGQAYYSRPNAATKTAVEGVPQDLWLRKTIAEKLQQINASLRDSSIFNQFGGPVELYIEDGHRDYALQQKLYHDIFPRLIKEQFPGLSSEQFAEKLKDLIAPPSNDSQHPSPHATGGAVDVILRYKQGISGFVAGSEIYVGHKDGDISERTYPDYFELTKPLSFDNRLAAANRRAFYAVMTGRAFGTDTEFQVNPTEWWHWSYGDQMWAKLKAEPAALYSLADK